MKVGVALGGGGARGLAHVRALEILDDCGVRPVAIAGTSIGAIIGALYASGMSGKEIRKAINRLRITREEKWRDLLLKKDDLAVWLNAVRINWDGGGLLRTDGFLRYVLDRMEADRFEDLEIPLHVMTTDFYEGEPYVFREGKLRTAIMASMAIPGVFAPVKHEGRILVDGGVVNNLPYDLLANTCDVTIAIDVSPTRHPKKDKTPKTLDVTIGMFDILMSRVTTLMMKEQSPTIYVRPDLAGIRVLEFDKIDLVFEQAAPAMEIFEQELRKLLDHDPSS